MAITALEVRFHLVGGQTVTFLMPAKEGETFNAEDMKETAKDFINKESLWLSYDEGWAFAVPSMANVAMIEVLPA
jgi:hypothetical protein